MNERLSRAAPGAIAPFLAAYADGTPQDGAPLVLVWKFIGKTTLDSAFKERNFPLNVEEMVMGRKLRIEDPIQRKLATLKVCTALHSEAHKTDMCVVYLRLVHLCM